jgi:hypothetical protein
VKLTPPGSYLEYRAYFDQAQKRLGLDAKVGEEVDATKLTPVPDAPDLRFEHIGEIKRHRKLWFDGPGVSSEKTEQVSAVARDAAALTLELQGLAGALGRVTSGMPGFGGGSSEQLSIQALQSINRDALRAATSRMKTLLDRLPASLSDRDMSSWDATLALAQPASTTELSHALEHLGRVGADFVVLLSGMRETISTALRVEEERNEPRTYFKMSFGGKEYILSLPSEMGDTVLEWSTASYGPFSRLKNPPSLPPPRADGAELLAIGRAASHTLGLAQDTLDVLARSADQLSGPSPLVIAEGLFPGVSAARVVEIAAAIEDITRTTTLSNRAIQAAVRLARIPLENEFGAQGVLDEAKSDPARLSSWLRGEDAGGRAETLNERISWIVTALRDAARNHADDDAAFVGWFGGRIEGTAIVGPDGKPLRL